jgi:DNA-binding transcriptional MerR regulator
MDHIEQESPKTSPASPKAEPAAPKVASRALARSEPKAEGAGASAESRVEVKVPAGLVTPVAGLPAIPAKRYFTIGEVSELCGVKPYVLRYWEQEFTQLRPMKRRGNRRYYQHHEVLLIRRIRELLYEQGFTISGARNQLTDHPSAGSADAPGAHDAAHGMALNPTALPDLGWQSLDLSALSRVRPDQVQALREALLSIRELLG